MTIFEMDSSNDDGNIPDSGGTIDDTEDEDIEIFKFASEEYKSTIVPFRSQRGKIVYNDQHQDRYKMSSGLIRPHRFLKNNPNASGRQPRWHELEFTGPIRVLPPELFTDFTHLTSLHLNHNELKHLPASISNLTNLVQLNLSNNRLRSLPSSMGDMISLCHLYLNGNQLRSLPYEMGKLFRLATLGLKNNPLQGDLGRILQESPTEREAANKILQYLLDHLAINTQPPPQREWKELKILPSRNYAQFTIMCYNVLCDKYATNALYSYCPSWALHWEYRKAAIIKELREYDCDIIALQEVETSQYTHLFLPELEAAGYRGLFSPKSRAKTMSEEDRRHVDGCAIFWKESKFEMQEEHLIEFTQLAMNKAEGSEHMLNRVMTRDNIGLCVVLKVKSTIYNGQVPSNINDNVTNSPLVVCTAHIHWDPEYCDVKLVQTMMLMHEIQTIIDNLGSERQNFNAQDIPLLLCGDFNSLPKSGVFSFLEKGEIMADHGDFKDFRTSDIGRQVLAKMSSSGERGLMSQQKYSHALTLESAIDENSMPFTNYTLDFKGIIDYVFATQSLQKRAILKPIDQNWFTDNKIIGFPHPHVPSDHVPVLVQYVIVPSKYKTKEDIDRYLGQERKYPPTSFYNFNNAQNYQNARQTPNNAYQHLMQSSRPQTGTTTSFGNFGIGFR